MADNDPDDFSGLPQEPTPKQLPAAYQLCRKKLVRANRSRTALKGHDDYRSSLILDLRAELKLLETGFRVEARERAAVHELNKRVLEIVQSLEKPLEEAASIVDEKDNGGLSGWAVRFARLLPLVLKLRQAKAAARRLLGPAGPFPFLPSEHESKLAQVDGHERELVPTTDSAVDPADSSQLVFLQPQPVQPDSIEVVQTILPIQLASSTPPHLVTPIGSLQATPETASNTKPVATSEALRRRAYGPLLLQFTGASFGVLLLPSSNQQYPEGLIPQLNNPWLPGKPVLVPFDHDDLEMAAIDAGFLAIEQDQSLIAELQTWLDRGLLPFAFDPLLQLPRLVHNASIAPISHVLVRGSQAGFFQEQIGGTGFDVDSDIWLGFELDSEEAEQFWRGLDQESIRVREAAPRLATCGGVAMVDRCCFLATGLGLPLLTAPLACDVERIQLQLSDGIILDYTKSTQEKDTAERQIWQPSSADRRRMVVAEGAAYFKGWLADSSILQRMIRLRALPEQVQFKRAQSLAYREDWGLPLGPLELPEAAAARCTPSVAALQWAHKRLHQGDANVDTVFELQMLECLSALFQRRPSLLRRDFLRLYAQLRKTDDTWPSFSKSVLRGWCEGGWLEEGVEQRGGRWRLHPVDPRLVRLPGGGLQLVGMLTARRLMGVLAIARELGLTIRSVSPTCAYMPRGWRFYGAVDHLGYACGLPCIATSDWVPEPTTLDWIIDASLESDSPSWPMGLQSHRRPEVICGTRGDYHTKPSQPLPERHRASIHLMIEAETSSYGKRRWHSHHPDRERVFTSCHFNRVALHALMVATGFPRHEREQRGLWPFGFTDSDIGQIDRLYDCEAYLPLPLARWAALTGRAMPGPTRHQPGDHTYRYHVSADLRNHQIRSHFLPLTSTS